MGMQGIDQLCLEMGIISAGGMKMVSFFPMKNFFQSKNFLQSKTSTPLIPCLPIPDARDISSPNYPSTAPPRCTVGNLYRVPMAYSELLRFIVLIISPVYPEIGCYFLEGQ